MGGICTLINSWMFISIVYGILNSLLLFIIVSLTRLLMWLESIRAYQTGVKIEYQLKSITICIMMHYTIICKTGYGPLQNRMSYSYQESFKYF